MFLGDAIRYEVSAPVTPIEYKSLHTLTASAKNVVLLIIFTSSRRRYVQPSR
jgi:hypothetical protein